jgi:hypothetical protein
VSPRVVTVVGVGAGLPGLFAGQEPVRWLVPTTGRDDTEALIGLLSSGLAGGGRTVAIVGDWLDAEQRDRVHSARTLLDTDRVALVETDLPPLAAGVLTALADALAARSPQAGELVAALPALAGELTVVSWLASVSKLRRPAPSVAQHARSALPGSAFAVVVAPDEHVHTLGRNDSGIEIAPAGQPAQLVVASGEGGDTAWVLETLNPALGSLPVLEVAPSEAGPSWWGTSKLVEAVAAPTDLPALAARLLPSGLAACRWCGEPLAASPCPFCGNAI